jgi:hypothetical protein
LTLGALPVRMLRQNPGRNALTSAQIAGLLNNDDSLIF